MLCGGLVQVDFTRIIQGYFIATGAIIHWFSGTIILQWRYNKRDGVSNHQPAFGSFNQPFVQAQIKENIKAPRHWPLLEEFIGDR